MTLSPVRMSSISTVPTTFKETAATKLYVFPCFLKPGSHKYLVRMDPARSDLMQRESEYFSHATLAPVRTMDVPV